MRVFRNEKGIALVTSLMITLISLTMILALLYMVTRGIQVSGTQKRYKTVLDAAYGGANLMAKDIMPYVITMINSSNFSGSTGLIANLNNTGTVASPYTGISLNAYPNSRLSMTLAQTCLQDKLTLATGAWPAACTDPTTNSVTAPPSEVPDMTFQLQGANTPYTVYAKIVDTKAGNTSMAGLQLFGSGVSESSNVITPKHLPYLYTIQIQGQKAGDTSVSAVSANVEALYAY
jgi:hypothetical protein